MAYNNYLPATALPETELIHRVVERIKIKDKIFSLVVYRILNGEIVVSIHQMAVAVRCSKDIAKQFLRQNKLAATKVEMPNHVVTDMVTLQSAVEFWKHLNNSGKGNMLTEIGKDFSKKYMS